MAEKKENRLKEITERLEQGVQELFTSERYAEYLRTMSQFHNYSFNNTLLIAMQKPDATLVAGYQAWQNKFGRHVKRGERGIQIIAPAPVREKHEVEKIDPETNEPVLREDGQPETEEIVTVIPRFRVTTVFDVSQTDGRPLPMLGTGDLTASVENYEIFMEAIQRVSSVPMRFDEIEGDAHGYYSNVDKEIVIQNGMSESQTMKTAIHEVAHATLHDCDFMQEQGIQKDQMTKEVEAESVAFAVCNYFGLDTSDYSFPYIAGWSSSREMSELRSSMDTVRKTAGELIESIGREFRELQQEREAEKVISEEQIFMDSTEKEFAIYQITDNSRNRRDLFSGTHFLRMYHREVDALGYEMIYHRALNAEKPETLDDLWLEFNTNHPEGYKERSLSISDVVVINQDGVLRAYMADDVGFKELPYFVQEREKLLQVKPMLEDRGIVNESSTGIYVEQHDGPWKTMDMQELNAQKFYFMEHERFGRIVAGVIVDGNGELVAQDIDMDEITGRSFDDAGVIMAIREYFEEKGIPIIDRRLEFDTVQPNLTVYRHDYEYAREHGELDLHRLSIQKNIQCKDAIEKAVRDHFDGMHLRSWVLDSPIEYFGMDRVGYVLASTVVMKDYDGRFSTSNKAWAKEQNTIEDFDLLKNDRRQDFMVDSHPAVLDGVVNIYRDKVREQEKVMEQEASLPVENMEQEEAVYIPEVKKYLYLQTATEGYDYTFYDEEYKELDGGVYDDPDIPFAEVLAELLQEEGVTSTGQYEEIDAEELLEKVERAEYFPEKTYQALSEVMFGEDAEIAFTSGLGYIAVEKYEDGYDYTVFDRDYKEIGGNTFLEPNVSMQDVVSWIFRDEKCGDLESKPISHEELKQSVLKAALDRLKDGEITPTSEVSMREKALNGLSRHEVEEGVLYFAQSEIDEMGLTEDVKLHAARVYGTRSRDGLYKEDSDLDVVLSYSGDISEDSFFNTLHEPGMKFAGLTLDINPISVEKSGTLDQFMERAEAYLDEKEEKNLNIEHAENEEKAFYIPDSKKYLHIQPDSYGYNYTFYDETYRKVESGVYDDPFASMEDALQGVLKDEEIDVTEQCVDFDSKELLELAGRAENEQPEKEATLTFYVAECMEFPVLGEYHGEIATAEEAVKLYEAIPADRMNGIKGIGFDLQDGSIYEGEYPLMSMGVIDMDAINHIEHYRNSPLVQKAIRDLSQSMQVELRQASVALQDTRQTPQEQTMAETVTVEPAKATPTAVKEESANKKVGSQDRANGKRESVLKALRERQNKLKEQEKTGEKQKDKSKDHKKGDIDL